VLATTADAFVSLGLTAAGYQYINTDDCWSELTRDNATRRIVPGPNFGGSEAAMKNLSKYINSKGMAFGMYGAAGETTCAGRAGGLYHEGLDAQTYADWGATYLKYDNCGQVNMNSYAKFSAMRDALNRTGKRILFSFEPHLTTPIEWPRYVGNAWRTGHDIGSHYGSMFSELVIGNSWANVGGVGGWNDDDMLEVGNSGLTIAEQRTHFALWCMVKSPLLIGSDVRSIAADSLALLKNKGLIAVNQDKLGKQASLVAVYTNASQQEQPQPKLARAREEPQPLADPLDPFNANSPAMTTCDYGPLDATPPAQSFRFAAVPTKYGGPTEAVLIQSADGKMCLSTASAKGSTVTGFSFSADPLVDCATHCVHQSVPGAADAPCLWNVKSSYLNGDVHDAMIANETSSQIRAAGDASFEGLCLKFNPNNASGLYLEVCNVDPHECSLKRCFYSASLGNEMWYLAANGQLIASYTHTHIPPMWQGARAASGFKGPFKGLDETDGNRLCQPPGKSATCKGATADGKLLLPQAEVEARCAVDAECAGFGLCVKCAPSAPGGVGYFRPLKKVVKIVNDRKWIYWTKGDKPPTPPPGPPPPAPSPPGNWFDKVDAPYCLATAPSSRPPTEPPQPRALSVPNCDEEGNGPVLVVFAGPLAGGDVVVGLANKCNGTHTITAHFGDIGAKAGTTYAVRDLMTGTSLPDATAQVSAQVGTHDIAVLRLSPK